MVSKKKYESPTIVQFEMDLTIQAVMMSGSGNTNGAGKVPPGWNNPHNPHNPQKPHGISDMPLVDNPFEQNIFE